MVDSPSFIPATIIFQDPQREAKGTLLAGVAATIVYAPTARQIAVVEAINIANRTAGAVAPKVTWFDGTNDITIINALSIPTGDRLLLKDLLIPLRNGQNIKVTGAANVDVTVVAKVTTGNLG